jgi:5'-nucleotidase
VKIILLTNDDGIEAKGLKILEESLQGLAHIVVVAPNQERSAVSHGLTLHAPLNLEEIKPDRYMLNGTPADCVIMALHQLFVQKPDLVISGINHGANLGDNIMYSGTVAAAREAACHEIPSIAISQEYDDKPISFKKGAAYVRNLVEAMLQNGPGGEICLNVNIPVRKIRGTRITRQGYRENMQYFYDNAAGSVDARKMEFLSDEQAIRDHYVSITPLQRDQTDYHAAQALMQQASRFFSRK